MLPKFVFDEEPKAPVTIPENASTPLKEFLGAISKVPEMCDLSSKKITLVDGSHTAHRAFNVLSDLKTSSGTPTGLVMGAMNSIHFYDEREKPDATFILWDFGKSKFRTNLYPEYKQSRNTGEPTDEDVARYESLIFQLQEVRQMFSYLGYPQLGVPGVEADDLIGILTHILKPHCQKINIVTGDKDMWQLIDSNVDIYDGMQKKWITIDSVIEKFGVKPEQIIYQKAICGDGSDNIPGVKGVGPKTAATVLNQFKDLDEVFSNSEEVGKMTRAAKIIEDETLVRRNLKLVKIITDDYSILEDKQIEPITQFLNTYIPLVGKPRTVDRKNFIRRCVDLEFNSIIEYLEKWTGI